MNPDHGSAILTIHSRGTAIVPMSVPLTQALGPMSGDLSQHALCSRYGSAFVPPNEDDKLGIALSTLGQAPLNALRHEPANGTCGWYVWGGEFSDHPDFFQSLHVHHLVTHAPQLIAYLGLAPGWRVLLAEGQCDVWRDPSLLCE